MIADSDYEMYSDVESIADSVEIEPYVSYDEEMATFVDRENNWMDDVVDEEDEDSLYSNNINYEDLPDHVPDDVIIDNLTPEMVRVIDRLYPGDIPDDTYKCVK